MILKLSTLLLVALAGGAFLAGCGSSSSSTSTTNSPSGTSTQATSAGTGAGTGAGTSSTQATSPLTPAQAKQAVSTCKHGVKADASIPAGTKPKLEKTCEKAASSGSAAALRKVAEEACIELITASHLPAGVIRERALATCKVNSSVGR